MSMDISGVASSGGVKPSLAASRGSEARNDGDGDDAGGTKPVVQPAVPAGHGQQVNKTA